MPYLALPTLAAALRPAGIQVIQRDLNAEVFDHILTRDFARRSLDRLLTLRPRVNGPPSDQVAWARQNGPRIAETVDAAKALIRSKTFYDGAASLPPS